MVNHRVVDLPAIASSALSSKLPRVYVAHNDAERN